MKNWILADLRLPNWPNRSVKNRIYPEFRELTKLTETDTSHQVLKSGIATDRVEVGMRSCEL